MSNGNSNECKPTNGWLGKISQLSMWCKAASAIVVSVIIIGGAFISFEYHFFTAAEAKELKIQVIDSLEQYNKGIQQQFEIRDKEAAQKELNYKLDRAIERMYNYKNIYKNNPNDPIARQDYEDSKKIVEALRKALGL